jgi:hypothetical protein
VPTSFWQEVPRTVRITSATRVFIMQSPYVGLRSWPQIWGMPERLGLRIARLRATREIGAPYAIFARRP